MAKTLPPRFEFPYGEKNYVVPFDLLTIEKVEDAAGKGIEQLAKEFETEKTRRFGAVGRVLHGALSRVLPEVEYETFIENFDQTTAVPIFSEVMRCLQEASNQLFGAIAEVEEKKGSGPAESTTPAGTLAAAAGTTENPPAL